MVITTKEIAAFCKPALVNMVYNHLYLTGQNGLPLAQNNVAVERLKQDNIPLDIATDVEDIVCLMSLVNRMVKDETFPYGTNCFYDKKTKVIKSILKNNPEFVSDILESDNLYNFIICGHSFHQPKNRFPNAKFTTVPEEYVADSKTIPFNRETYLRCMLSMNFYITKNF